ncbi:methylated-DNA--[protein]-cysteine S-methyltransferase [Denitrobacterium detoxificans]|jgi:methylated-DNA-[protein]-cysteine S-methyltransferase|uniref:methylated-DNA--[protein]-cysteine S-methyltransferase n=1 Tax=Denitrobacterium detoxificans TaxID=79604 RepID=UPI0026EDB6E7|nr:methylated-DNA--[protein]-cysteine S-methyltransferase [Denitrobacterium detoxificans]MBE6465202.1 methylated-DNA--[protein]-cysteine S-methyltransferase [Denitrobacterium detoxificans]
MLRQTYFAYNTPLGQLTLSSNGEAITGLAFGAVELDGDEAPTLLTNRAANELQEYFAGKRQAFTVPLSVSGSVFQESVWHAIARIPYGQTRSYSDIAASAGSPGAYRACGMAANANPIPIFIPCHRVIGANGKLVGYAGGMDIKEFLLNLERDYA